VVGKEIAVKKYVVRLSAEERAQLDELIDDCQRQGRKKYPECYGLMAQRNAEREPVETSPGAS
jgi:hypothetical protein